MLYCSCDLDHDPTIFMYESDLTILKMYLHTKNEVSRSRLSEVRALQTNIQAGAAENIPILRIRGW